MNLQFPLSLSLKISLESIFPIIYLFYIGICWSLKYSRNYTSKLTLNSRDKADIDPLKKKKLLS